MKNETYTVKMELVTPKSAEIYLETSPRNRRINDYRVDRYAADMMNGKWSPASMIILDDDGQLVDGHHRLRAVIQAGVSVWMVVFYGLEKESIPFIDTGRTRSAGDMLAFIDGLDEVGGLRNKSTICRLVLAMHSGDLKTMIGFDAIASFMLDHSDTVNSAYDYYGKVKTFRVTLAYAVAAYLIIEKHGHSPAVQDFFEKVTTGENLTSGMPEYALRSALFQNGNRGGGAQRQQRDLFYTLTAWHDRCTGNERKLYRVPKQIETKALLALV